MEQYCDSKESDPQIYADIILFSRIHELCKSDGASYELLSLEDLPATKVFTSSVMQKARELAGLELNQKCVTKLEIDLSTVESSDKTDQDIAAIVFGSDVLASYKTYWIDKEEGKITIYYPPMKFVEACGSVRFGKDSVGLSVTRGPSDREELLNLTNSGTSALCVMPQTVSDTIEKGQIPVGSLAYTHHDIVHWLARLLIPKSKRLENNNLTQLPPDALRELFSHELERLAENRREGESFGLVTELLDRLLQGFCDRLLDHIPQESRRDIFSKVFSALDYALSQESEIGGFTPEFPFSIESQQKFEFLARMSWAIVNLYYDEMTPRSFFPKRVFRGVRIAFGLVKTFSFEVATQLKFRLSD